MPFYIARVSGRSSQKRVAVDEEAFETSGVAETMARARWPEGAYFIVEAEDALAAGRRAVGESRPLDGLAPGATAV